MYYNYKFILLGISVRGHVRALNEELLEPRSGPSTCRVAPTTATTTADAISANASANRLGSSTYNSTIALSRLLET